MVKRNTKYGFSLAEALISMLILSIFFAVSSRMITQRPKEEVVMSPHAYFECYYNDEGKLVSDISGGASKEEDTTNEKCSFSPARGASVYSISILRDNVVCSRLVEQMNNTFDIIVPTSDSTKASKIGSDSILDNKGNCNSPYEKETWDEFKSYVELTTPGAKITSGDTPRTSGVYINW